MLNDKLKISFLILVLVQGIHSIEEYIGKLWIVFEPAKILSGLFSNDIEKGFLIINIGLFVFGFFSWAILVRRNYTIAKSIIWFWIIIEMINGIGHSIWALYERTYVPGVFTAPFLLILAIYLSREIRKT